MNFETLRASISQSLTLFVGPGLLTPEAREFVKVPENVRDVLRAIHACPEGPIVKKLTFSVFCDTIYFAFHRVCATDAALGLTAIVHYPEFYELHLLASRMDDEAGIEAFGVLRNIDLALYGHVSSLVALATSTRLIRAAHIRLPANAMGSVYNDMFPMSRLEVPTVMREVVPEQRRVRTTRAGPEGEVIRCRVLTPDPVALDGHVYKRVCRTIAWMLEGVPGETDIARGTFRAAACAALSFCQCYAYDDHWVPERAVTNPEWVEELAAHGLDVGVICGYVLNSGVPLTPGHLQAYARALVAGQPFKTEIVHGVYGALCAAVPPQNGSGREALHVCSNVVVIVARTMSRLLVTASNLVDKFGKRGMDPATDPALAPLRELLHGLYAAGGREGGWDEGYYMRFLWGDGFVRELLQRVRII